MLTSMPDHSFMPYRLKNLRVLLIDDNQPVRLLIRSLLLDLGFNLVDMAENIEEGWNLYCANTPDVILLDWRLDNPDGLEFVRRLRKSRSSPTPDIPVIMMTGYTNKDLLFKARDAGISEFLIKPFTIDTLTRQFSQLIEKPRDFVITNEFVGPDRRRRREEISQAAGKRKVDPKTIVPSESE